MNEYGNSCVVCYDELSCMMEKLELDPGKVEEKLDFYRVPMFSVTFLANGTTIQTDYTKPIQMYIEKPNGAVARPVNTDEADESPANKMIRTNPK